MTIQRFTFKKRFRHTKIVIGTSEVLVRNLIFSRHYHQGDHLRLTFPNNQIWSLRGPVCVDAYNRAMLIACDGKEVYRTVRPSKEEVWQGPFGNITFRSNCRWRYLIRDINGRYRRVAHWQGSSNGEGVLNITEEALVPVLLTIIFSSPCEFG